MKAGIFLGVTLVALALWWGQAVGGSALADQAPMAHITFYVH
jgi:hypothetical protein